MVIILGTVHRMSAKLKSLRTSYSFLSVKYVACITDSDGTDHQQDESVYHDGEVIFDLDGGHDKAGDSSPHYDQEQQSAHHRVCHQPWYHQTSVILQD